jgi:hypothetical protein
LPLRGTHTGYWMGRLTLELDQSLPRGGRRFQPPRSRETLDKTRVSLVLERPHGVLSDPFLACDVPNGSLPGFLEAISGVGVYLPIRVIVEDQVVTGVTYSADCISIQGQPTERRAR